MQCLVHAPVRKICPLLLTKEMRNEWHHASCLRLEAPLDGRHTRATADSEIVVPRDAPFPSLCELRD